MQEAQTFLTEQERKREVWSKQYQILEDKFTPKVLRRVINDVFDNRMTFTVKKVEDIYNEYLSLSQKGVSYQERINKIDMSEIKFLEEYLKKTQAKKASYKLRGLHEWLTVGDYEWIKRWGIRKFVNFNLDVAIV